MALLDFSELMAASCSCFCRCSQQPRGHATQPSLQERIQDSPEQPSAAPSSSSASFQTPCANNNTAGVAEPCHPAQCWTLQRQALLQTSQLGGSNCPVSLSLRLSPPNPASLSFYRRSLVPPTPLPSKLFAFRILS